MIGSSKINALQLTINKVAKYYIRVTGTVFNGATNPCKYL
jgi:hypothetical protein